MKKNPLTCHRPDRHNPKLVCGYPLPCPFHTIVVEQDDLFGGVLKDDSTKEGPCTPIPEGATFDGENAHPGMKRR